MHLFCPSVRASVRAIAREQLGILTLSKLQVASNFCRQVVSKDRVNEEKWVYNFASFNFALGV